MPMLDDALKGLRDPVTGRARYTGLEINVLMQMVENMARAFNNNNGDKTLEEAMADLEEILGDIRKQQQSRREGRGEITGE